MFFTSISITANGIDITADRKTWFHRFEHLSIPYSNIVSVTDDQDVQHNNQQFYTIKVKHPSKKIILTAPKKQAPVEMQQFSFELHKQISAYNHSSKALGTVPIKDGSFYTGTFAKVLTAVLVILMVVLAIAKVADPAAVPWYKLIWFYTLSLVWLANVYRARKKAREKLNNSEAIH